MAKDFEGRFLWGEYVAKGFDRVARTDELYEWINTIEIEDDTKADLEKRRRTFRALEWRKMIALGDRRREPVEA